MTETNQSRPDLSLLWPVSKLDDPHLAGRYDKRSAWMYLVRNASWIDDREMATHAGVIRLCRGEVPAAIDHLAKVWRWTPKQVRTFLGRLAGAGWLIRGRTKRPFPATYFIANFDSYVRPIQKGAIEGANDRATEGRTKGDTVTTVLRLDSPLPPNRGAAPVDCQRAYDDFNKLALRVGLQQAKALTPERKGKIAARLRDKHYGGAKGWTDALANIERSSFLTGQDGGRGWRVTLDWLVKPANFAKVVEGTYGNGRATKLPVAHSVPGDDLDARSKDELFREYGLEVGQ